MVNQSNRFLTIKNVIHFQKYKISTFFSLKKNINPLFILKKEKEKKLKARFVYDLILFYIY